MVARNSMSLTAAIIAGFLFWCASSAATEIGAVRINWDEVHDKLYGNTEAHEYQNRELGESTSLSELLVVAESSNPGLRAAFDRWTAALGQIPQAKSLPDPKLSYAYFLDSVETRVGPQRQKFGFSQSIPLFGKLGLRGQVAIQAANAASEMYEASRLDLRYRVTKLWNAYYYLRRATDITEENVRLLTDFENVALSRYAVGAAPHSAVIRAQVELGRLEDRLRTLIDQRTPILASLNAELNRPEYSPIAWPDSIDNGMLLLTQPELRDALLAKNPQLTSLSFTKEKNASAASLAGRSPLPDLTIGVEYIDTDEARFSGVSGSGQDALIAKATVNIPLWFGRYRAEKAQAVAQLSATENEYLHLKNNLLAAFERVHFELRDAERRVDLYAYTLIPKAHQSVEVTEDAFTAGEADFLDLIDAQRTLLEFELQHARALTDRATRLAKIKQIIGVDPMVVRKVKE